MNFSIPVIKKYFRGDIELKKQATSKKTTAFNAEYITNNKKLATPSNYWHMVTMAASSSSKANSSIKLILDKGKPNEQEIDFIIHKKKSVKRLFYSVPPQTVSLLSDDKDLILEKLSIFHVSYFFAFTRSISKLTNNHPHYFNKKRVTTLNDIRLIARERKLSISAVLYQKYKEVTNPPPTSEAKAYALWMRNNEKDIGHKSLPTGLSFLLNTFDKKGNQKNNESIKFKSYYKLPNEFYFDPLKNNINKNYLVVIEEGTRIAKNALYDLSEAIRENPNSELIYTDDDSINQAGERHSPHFKPDWNPDLFYSCNYIGNTYIIKADIFYKTVCVDDIQKLLPYQLLFKLVKKMNTKNIIHLPKISFHKVEHKKADHRKINFNRVVYPAIKSKPKVSILIPTKDKRKLLEQCIVSILKKSACNNYEIVIINNNSTKKTTLDYFSKIEQHPNISVINYKGEFNFSAMNNYAATKAKGEFLLLLNNDTEVITKNWLDELLRYATHPEVGCVGAKLLYSDKTIQHAGIILGINGIAGHAHRGLSSESHGYQNRLKLVQNFSAVTAACLMVKKDVYHEAGGLTESLAISMNDVDFCLKVKELGYRNIWTPAVLLYHHESQSRGTEKTTGIKKLLTKKCVTLNVDGVIFCKMILPTTQT